MANLHSAVVVGIISVIAVSASVIGTGAADDPPPGPTVVITGANRGIGLAFARRLAAEGFQVIGTARDPEAAEALRALGVRVEQLDVTDAESVRRLAAAIGDAPVDVLINNAGVGSFVRTLEALDFDKAENVFKVNVLGPMRVTQALLPALRRGDRKLVVNITSGMASIENNTRGGGYAYRESKAGLNMFTRSLAAELEPEGFICIALSPGWVRTDMGGPNARLTPEESISAMLEVIAGVTTADSGRFFSHEGRTVPW